MPHKLNEPVDHSEPERLYERRRIYEQVMGQPYKMDAGNLRQAASLLETQGSPSLAGKLRAMADEIDPPNWRVAFYNEQGTETQGSPSLARKLRAMADEIDPPQVQTQLAAQQRAALLQAASWFEMYALTRDPAINETRAAYCRKYADFK